MTTYIWDYRNERELLEDIYKLFLESWNIIRGDDEQCDLIVSGIGVCRVDIGYLYSKCIEHSIDTKENLFEVFYQLRFIDLEQVALPYFQTNKNVLYPKNTAELLQKFKIDKKRESGRGVWDMYDNEKYIDIEDRNYGEVQDFLKIYKDILGRMIANKLAERYSDKSIKKVLSGLTAEDDKKLLLKLLNYDSEEERYYTPFKLEELITTAKLFFKANYWKATQKQ